MIKKVLSSILAVLIFSTAAFAQMLYRQPALTASSTSTLTNKTIDGDDNTVQDLPYSAIKSDSRTGLDAKLVTGTPGANNTFGVFDSNGDLISAGIIKGTMTDGRICTYTSSGTLLNCTTTCADITGSADLCDGSDAGGGGSSECVIFAQGIQSSKLSGGDITTLAPLDAGSRPWYQLFDDSTVEESVIQGITPDCYDGTSSIDVTYVFSVASTQSGDLDVEFRGKWMATTPNSDSEDFNSDGFASAQACDHDLATNQTAGYLRSCTVTFTNAQADSIADGDGFRFHYDRNTSTANDASGDVELIGIRAEVNQ